MTDALRDIINEAMQVTANPEAQDNPDTSDTEAIAAEAVTEEPVDDTDVEVDEDAILDVEESEDDDEESETEETEATGETYEVKVDGETVTITLEEALAGYQRQADYTRKAQALAAEREAIEAAKQDFSEVVQQVNALDQAWEDNPISVIAHFTASTENPTQAVALLIKELASSNLLEKEFLDIFGITPEVRSQWAQEGELSKLRSQVSKTETEQKSRAQEAEMEAAVQRAIVQFDKDIDDIIQQEGLALSGAQRAEFRKQLAGYARDNEITNLKAAYKALRFEEDAKKRKVAAKAAERAQAKKATSAVARKSSSDAGSAPVGADSTDLRSLITSTMKELGG